MDDLGFKKPTKKERIKASIVNAIDNGDFSGERKLQDQLEWTNEHERRVRSVKKARAKVIARCLADMNDRTRSPEPDSDNEDGASAATYFSYIVSLERRFYSSSSALILVGSLFLSRLDVRLLSCFFG